MSRPGTGSKNTRAPKSPKGPAKSNGGGDDVDKKIKELQAELQKERELRNYSQLEKVCLSLS
jgi:hypothetical protein